MVRRHPRDARSVRLTVGVATSHDHTALLDALARVGLADAIACPRCRAALAAGATRCAACGSPYPVAGGVWCLLAGAADEHAAFYTSEDDARFGRDETGMPDWIVEPLAAFTNELSADGALVEIGAGRGAFAGIHPNYVATDFSMHALRQVRGEPRLQCDAQALPFADASLTAVFSVAALEHVPHPERAIAEIDRCLRPGGRAFLYPAWYVRPWAARALAQRRYAEVSPLERLEKLTILVRDRRPYRFLRVLPGRLRRELELRRGAAIALRYRRLRPNLDEYVDSDSDAYTSLDPQAVAAFFLARGYRDLRRPTWQQRLLYAYEPVVVEKPTT
jgi:ubiquinone/menaquinone biosynthesis C-methylase UbiE